MLCQQPPDLWRLARLVHDPGKMVLDLAVTTALGGDAWADAALVRDQPSGSARPSRSHRAPAPRELACRAYEFGDLGAGPGLTVGMPATLSGWPPSEFKAVATAAEATQASTPLSCTQIGRAHV